jgi:hypothetical protein
VNLHDCAIRDISEHRAPFRDECVPPTFDLLHRRAVKLLAHAEVDRALYHGDVLVNRVFMRGDDRSGKLPNSHHERFSSFLRVAVKNLNVLRHRPDGDDAMLMGLWGLARPSSQSNVKYQGK